MDAETQDERRWWALVAVSLSTALVWMAATGLNIALPQITRQLHASLDELQWMVTAFTLAGVLIIASGRLADIHGRRHVFLAGTGLLVLASVFGAVADTSWLLIASRALMGVGAALLLPASLAIVATTFRGKERSAAIAIWISLAWGAQAFGPLVGGALTELGQWRLIFWVNLPLGLIAIALARWACRESRDELADPRIDWPGFATISLGLVALMLALTEANTLGAGSPVIVGLLVASALLLGAFIVIERRTESPIVHLGFFRSPDFIGGNWANFAANFVFGAVLFFMALYLQDGLRFSALDAGVLLLPATVVMLAFAPVGRLWSDRAGPRWPTVTGLTLVTLGAWTITLVTVSSEYLDLLPGFVILGAGIGLIITPITTATLNAVPASSSGSASGVFKAGSMLGGSFGVAASVALFQSSGSSRIQDLVSAASIEISSKRLDDLEALLVDSGSAQTVLGPLTEKIAAEVIAIVRETFVYALSQTIWLSVALAASGAVLALVLIRGRIHPQALEVVTGERPAPTGTGRRTGS